MKIYKYVPLVVVLAFQMKMVNAQNNGLKTVRYYEVGDTLSKVKLRNLINYPRSTANLDEFKDKLIILDFWSTSCASCIQSWPKLLELQRKFNSQIQIVLVNAWEDSRTVQKVFDRRKKLTNVRMTLPASCKDTTILDYFRVSGLPHVVWIGKDGVIQSITSGGLLIEKNIISVLGGFTKMQQKINADEYIRADNSRPLFINGNGGTSNDIISYSILTRGYQKNVLGSVGMMALPPGYSSYITCVNVDIKSMYSWAYSNRTSSDGVMTLLKDNKIVLNVRDTTRYLYKVDGEIQYDNLFSYQFIGSGLSRDELQSRMQVDLCNYFGLMVEWRKRKMKALVLTASDTALIRYKGGVQQYNIMDGIQVNGISVTQLIRRLEDDTDYHMSPYPIVDETGFSGLLGGLDLRVDGYGSNYSELNRELQKYKMGISIQDRIIDVLVVSESHSNIDIR